MRGDLEWVVEDTTRNGGERRDKREKLIDKGIRGGVFERIPGEPRSVQTLGPGEAGEDGN